MPISLAAIKDKLDSRIGQRMKVVSQAGRKKTTERHGILKETYRSVFVVDLDQQENAFERVSYSYTDVLTKNVQIAFDDETTEA
ncbi:Veg protein [Lactiplantibacillus plantarum]|nr:Veg protein [Lactiplantibacillus plantarum]